MLTKATKPAADEKVVALVTPNVAAPVVKAKDFFDRVVDRSGMKKKDAKAAIEATLAELAEAIEKGEELRLPPLGKLKVARSGDVPGGKMITVKLRTGGNAGKAGNDPLADDED